MHYCHSNDLVSSDSSISDPKFFNAQAKTDATTAS